MASVAPNVRRWAEDRGQADKVIALLGWVQKEFPHLEGKLCGTQYYRLSFQGRVVAAFHLRKKGILMQFPLTLQDVTGIELEWRESEPSHRSDWSEALVSYSADAHGILRTVLVKLI